MALKYRNGFFTISEWCLLKFCILCLVLLGCCGGVAIMEIINSPSVATRLKRFRTLDVQLFDRLCQFVSQLCLMISRNARVIWRKKNCLTFAVKKGPDDRSAHSLRSSKKSHNDFVLGSKTSLCRFRFVVACDCGLGYFPRKILSTFLLLLLLKFSKICSICFR